MTAKERYEHLKSKRNTPLNRAERCAELTIPSICPPEGSTQETRFNTPYQSLGARGVNNLASKLLLALLPPNSSFFRLRMSESVLNELGASRTQVEKALQGIERGVNQKIERSNARVILFEAIKHLIVTGNGLVYVPRSADMKFYGLPEYVVQRDGSGNVTESVVLEMVSPTTLKEETRTVCKVDEKSDKDVEIYTHIEFSEGRVKWRQEINGVTVPDTESDVPQDRSPWIFLRWQAVNRESYGRGLVEEYLGDLISLEELSKAIIGFSSVAAKIVFLVKPNAVTMPEDLAKANTGDFVPGELDDIQALQLDKFNDFRVSKEVINDLTMRLSHAFLLTNGTIRDAERVTAEEIRLHAQELEDVLGGVYTVQARELQLPLVKRFMSLMRDADEIPKLPKGTVEPTITTGFEALGRGHDLNRLRQFIGDVQATLGPQALARMNIGALITQLATGYGIDTADLVKSEEQVQQEQAAAMQQQLAQDSIPGAVQEVTKGAVKQQTQ